MPPPTRGAMWTTTSSSTQPGSPTRTTPAEQTRTAWARAFLAALQPHRAGVYINFLDSDNDGLVREAYGDDTYRRLTEVKAKYDPDNVLHNNKNISAPQPGAVTAAHSPHQGPRSTPAVRLGGGLVG